MRNLMPLLLVIFLWTLPALAETRTKPQPAGKVVTAEMREDDKTFRYLVEVKYPQLQGHFNAKGQNRLNLYLQNLLIAKVADFKKDVLENNQNAPPDPAMQSGFWAEYNTVYQGRSLLSLRLYFSPYYAGAAHPNHYYAAVNFNPVTGEFVDLNALFKDGADYLKVISDYCIAQLQARAAKEGFAPDDEWIRKGAGPEWDNFRIFNLTDKELLFTFEPYQVGPYVAGTQEVAIPLGYLKGLLANSLPR